MPIIDLDELKRNVELLGQGHSNSIGDMFIAAYVNYTPLMLGDHVARHFRCIDPECSQVAPSPGVVAQAIRGKARWLARVTLASLRGCKANSYRDIETGCFELVVDKAKDDRRVKAGLIEIMFGSLSSIQLASPFILQARLRVRNEKPYKYERNGRECSRLRLMMLNREEKELLYPWGPGALEAIVSVKLAPHWPRLLERLDKLNSDTSISLEKLPCLYTVLVASTPLLLGIGKATTRGFGRFRIKDLDTLGNMPVSKLCQPQWSKFVRALKLIHSKNSSSNASDALNELLRSILNIASDVTGIEIDDSTELGMVPRLSYALNKAATICAKNVHSFDEAVYAIGEAVLKQKWKRILHRDRGSGLDFHTWPLGLPRKSEIRCICGRGDRADKDKKHTYGYIVVSKSTAESFKLLKKPNTCIASKHCKKDDLTVEDLIESKVKLRDPDIEQYAKDIRHVSSLILFPLPGEACMIAMLPLPAYSLNLGVDIKDVDIEERSAVPDLLLLHLGGHFERDERGKPKPCCNTHVVTVQYAATRSSISAPSEQPGDNLCGCGKDPAGVQQPPSSKHKQRASSLFEHIIEVSFEWVKYVLEQGLWRD